MGADMTGRRNEPCRAAGSDTDSSSDRSGGLRSHNTVIWNTPDRHVVKLLGGALFVCVIDDGVSDTVSCCVWSKHLNPTCKSCAAAPWCWRVCSCCVRRVTV